MRITLVGSRHFGVTTLNMLRERGVDIARVVVHDAEDRLAGAAKAAAIQVVMQADPKLAPLRRSDRFVQLLAAEEGGGQGDADRASP